jgi:hypothetical protein
MCAASLAVVGCCLDVTCHAPLQIEETHPLKKVQQQAYNLRFILQAPKLKRGPDEVVKIPVLQIEERKKCAAYTLTSTCTATTVCMHRSWCG